MNRAPGFFSISDQSARRRLPRGPDAGRARRARGRHSDTPAIRWPTALAALALLSGIALAMPAPTQAAGEPTRAIAPETLLEQALNEYQSAMDSTARDERLRRFARAEQLFRQLIEGGETRSPRRNAALWVNLGNAALQAEHVGEAILAFRRALALDPAHAQAAQNLQHARSTLPEWARAATRDDLWETLFFWQTMLSRRGIALLCGGFFLATCGLLALGVLRQASIIRNAAIVPFVAWLVLGLSLLWDRPHAREAVVVLPDAVLRAADSENAPRRLSSPLPDGAEVQVRRQRERWTEIEISGRTGWVRTIALRPVVPPAASLATP